MNSYVLFAAEITDRINAQLAEGSHGRLFAVVFLAGKQFRVTDEDIIMITGTYHVQTGERIRMEKVCNFLDKSSIPGTFKKCYSSKISSVFYFTENNLGNLFVLTDFKLILDHGNGGYYFLRGLTLFGFSRRFWLSDPQTSRSLVVHY